ncbi:AI-2E family transporter [Streptomyces tateyamensis]|uniref:AI-2E family transporter n=1 Tax=Streptomyces tateyamensis TaxID=565073 RepID=A0A2V4NX37_9ACTN|nr:AI-2E family transporter [Streptomyces tateyamensis]PYC65454.1 AI-2E family transporter [Streptomyces tateyamensis]
MDSETPAGSPARDLAPVRRAGGPRTRIQSPGRTAPQVKSWFRAGFALSVGALLAWHLTDAVLQLTSLLTLLLLAVFVAVSLEPVVAWLVRHGLRRAWSVAVVVVGLAALLAALLAMVIPPVDNEVGALVDAVPGWLQQLHDHQSTLGRIEDHYHLVERVKEQLGHNGSASSAFGGVLGAGQLLLSTVTSTVIVVTVSLYVMAALPVIKTFCYRFVPRSRREEVEEITEEILLRTGRYMLGNVLTSAVAGLATFVWCAATGVPYAGALGVFVALMDLVPMVGSTIGGVVVSLVALSVSLPVALATAGFYIAFRLLEDYLIMPRAMKFVVDVHPIVTVVAVLLGGALLGLVGALVAVPSAVALGLILDAYVFPRIENV